MVLRRFASVRVRSPHGFSSYSCARHPFTTSLRSIRFLSRRRAARNSIFPGPVRVRRAYHDEYNSPPRPSGRKSTLR